MIARSPVTNPSLRKSRVTRVPMKNAAGTRFGVNQTVKMRPTDPYRAYSGIGAIPRPSIERSPSRVGMLSPVVAPKTAIVGSLLPSFGREADQANDADARPPFSP